MKNHGSMIHFSKNENICCTFLIFNLIEGKIKSFVDSFLRKNELSVCVFIST